MPKKNSQNGTSWKNPTAWLSRLTTMPTVVTMDTRAQRKKIYRTALPSRSRHRRRLSLTRIGARVSVFEGIVGSPVSTIECFIIRALFDLSLILREV